MENDYDVIHIFGQKAFHDEAFIVANYEGMKKLYDAIEEVLQKFIFKRMYPPNKEKMIEVYVNDGEGYDLYIKIDDRLTMHDGKYAVPYTADYAREKQKDAIYPWS